MTSSIVVRDNPLFNNLTESQVQSILALAHEKLVMGGDTVLRQFEGNSDLVIVLQGMAAVKTFSGEIVAEIGPGGVLGEVSLIDDATRSATVVMKSDGRIATISSTALRKLLDEDIVLRSHIMENVARILASRLRAANVQLDFAR